MEDRDELEDERGPRSWEAICIKGKPGAGEKNRG